MPHGPHRLVFPLALLCASLFLVSPEARAERDYYPVSSSERPKVRALIGGGIALPASNALWRYSTGGGISVGVEWPQSDYHSLLLRLDYDHLGQDVKGYSLSPGTVAGSADLTVLHADVRFQREVGVRPIRNYIEGGLGLSYRSLADALDYDPTTFTFRSSTDRGVAGAFVFTTGTVYQPEGAGFGFFLEAIFVFMMRSEDTNYVPLRVGVTFP